MKSHIISLKNSVGTFLELLYPKSCVLCANSTDDKNGILCGDCYKKLHLLTPPFCYRCARPLNISENGARCNYCRNEDHVFNRLIAIGIYEGVLKETIHAFKFGKKELLGEWFAGLMAEFLNKNKIDILINDLVIPVPMHPVKRKERGFNQSELLSLKLSKTLNLPHRPDILDRKVPGAVQSSLGRKERFNNVKGVFSVKKGSEINGKKVILVDDIFTTGATSNECARILKERGAKEVTVIVLARGMQD